MVIDLSYQMIDSIDTFAFTFLEKGGPDLIINLEHSNNTLNGSSFFSPADIWSCRAVSVTQCFSSSFRIVGVQKNSWPKSANCLSDHFLVSGNLSLITDNKFMPPAVAQRVPSLSLTQAETSDLFSGMRLLERCWLALVSNVSVV